MISLKGKKEIEIMHEGGRRLRSVLERVLSEIKPGVSEEFLDQVADREIIKQGGKASFKMVPGYSWATCLTVNGEVVHGIPGVQKLKSGDIIGVDVGMYFRDYHTDLATTVKVGKVDKEAEEFLEVGERTLGETIKKASQGNFVGDLSLTIQQGIERAGYKAVRDLTGHGIGRKLHEEPAIPCFSDKKREKTVELKEGMTLAIEIIYNQGSEKVVLEEDGWTISARDGTMSGLFEETVAITENGPLILTR